MATVLRLRFPGGRYHATPWGHHVNEGLIEWPPSPWRLLRALLATGFLKLDWPPEGPPETARRLIERLAALSPTYALPPVALSHSRHYVDAAGKKPLIFDTWARIEEGAVEVAWDVDLPQDERALLAELARVMGYLGRAESWVVAELIPDRSAPHNCVPEEGGAAPGQEALRVLCPMGAQEYASWRAERVASIEADLAANGKAKGAAGKKRMEGALAPYPRDLIAALCVETSALQAQGWSAAPGSRERIYLRPADALSVGPPVMARAPAASEAPFALLALATPSRGTSALPPLHRVFPQGRILHRALASVIGWQMGGDADLGLRLLGCTAEGKARLPHQHAHLLHLDLDEDQRLDHVLVYVPMRLTAAAQEALLRLRRTYMKGGVGELQVALAGVGNAEALLTGAHGAGPEVSRALEGVLGPARTWMSATPYVAPRRIKRQGKNSLAGLVQDECVRRGLPAPLEVREIDRGEETLRSLRHYVLHDVYRGVERRPLRPERHVLSLRFAEPVPGPICLGYGAHAGLGRFQAVRE